MRSLTEKQEAFVRHYVEGGDAKAAAKAAGYADPGPTGSNLKKDLAKEIQQAVSERFAHGTPKVIDALEQIIFHGKNESARMRAIDSWLDRAGLKPVNEHADVTNRKTFAEITAELESMFGKQLTEVILSRLDGPPRQASHDEPKPIGNEITEERRRIDAKARTAKTGKATQH